MILDVISNDPNHKNDTFLQKNGRKASFKNVTMVKKMLHVYISVTVPDRSIVTIIHRYKAVNKRYRIAKCDEKTLPVRDNFFLV